MKKVFLMTALCLSLFACGNSKAEREVKQQTDTSKAARQNDAGLDQKRRRRRFLQALQPSTVNTVNSDSRCSGSVCRRGNKHSTRLRNAV